jgi:hypothetical protein
MDLVMDVARIEMMVQPPEKEQCVRFCFRKGRVFIFSSFHSQERNIVGGSIFKERIGLTVPPSRKEYADGSTLRKGVRVCLRFHLQEKYRTERTR